MRGLKPADREYGTVARLRRRAVCPANEGIETCRIRILLSALPFCRAVCPANEGIETSMRQQHVVCQQQQSRGLPR